MASWWPTVSVSPSHVPKDAVAGTNPVESNQNMT